MDVNELLLAAINEIKQDIKEVRQLDIPTLMTKLESHKTETKIEIKNLKEKTATQTKIWTLVGGFIAVATSVAIAMIK